MSYLVIWHLDGCPFCGDRIVEEWQSDAVAIQCKSCEFHRRLPTDISPEKAARTVLQDAAAGQQEQGQRARISA